MVGIIVVLIAGAVGFSVFNVISLKKEQHDMLEQQEELKAEKQELEKQLEEINDPKNIEEERRLFYVAITRAREKLIINYSDSIITKEGEEKIAIPSRLLEEIPPELFRNEEISPEERKKAQAEMLRELLAKHTMKR